MTGVVKARVKLAELFAAMLEAVQTTEEPWREQEELEDPGTKVRFVGTGSVTVTFEADAVPEFVTVITYVMGEPAFAEEGPVFVRLR